MVKFIFKNTVCIAVLLCLLCGSVLTSGADDSSQQTSRINPGSNLFQNMQSMIPGETYSDTVFLYNESTEAVVFYIGARSAGVEEFDGDQNLKVLSDKLLELLELKMILYNVDNTGKQGRMGKIVYNGAASGASKSDGLPHMLDCKIKLASVGAGESVLVEFIVQVPSDLSSDFYNTEGKFIWDFYFEGHEAESGFGGGNISSSPTVPASEIDNGTNKANIQKNGNEQITLSNLSNGKTTNKPSITVIGREHNFDSYDRNGGFLVPFDEIEPVTVFSMLPIILFTAVILNKKRNIKVHKRAHN